MNGISDMETIFFFQFFGLETDTCLEETFILFWSKFILLHETIFIPHGFEEIITSERLNLTIIFFLLSKES